MKKIVLLLLLVSVSFVCICRAEIQLEVCEDGPCRPIVLINGDDVYISIDAYSNIYLGGGHAGAQMYSGHNATTFEYSINGSPWNFIPDQFLDMGTIPNDPDAPRTYTFQASIRDFLGSNYESMLGRNFLIRVNYDVWTYERYIVPIPIILSCPSINSIAVHNVDCAGGSNGNMNIYLSRELYGGEQMRPNLKIKDGLLNEYAGDFTVNGQVLTIPNLAANIYAFKITTTMPVPAVQGMETTFPAYTYYLDAPDDDPNFYRENIAITEPDTVRVSAQKFDAVCFGDFGSIQFTAIGGTQDNYVLHYRKQGTEYSTQNFPTTGNVLTIQSLTAGIYDYYVTDNNNCVSETHTIEIRQSDEAISIFDVTTQNATGQGKTDGQIQFAVQGGSGDYIVSYQFESQNHTLDPVEPDKYIIVGAAGEYQITIMDSGGCVYSETFTVYDIPPLTAIIEKTNSILCHDGITGQLVAHASGGIPNYTYQWLKKTGETYSELSSENDSVVGNLFAGIYGVKITDSNIPASDTTIYYTLTEPDALMTSVFSQDVTCFGNNNGQLRIAVQGGTKPYTLHYRQDENDTFLDMQPNVEDSVFLVSNLPAGIYRYYVTDQNDCSDGTLESQTINQPDAPLTIASVGLKMPTGFGLANGRVTLQITGGTPETTGAKYHVTWKNAQNTTLTSTESVNTEGVFVTVIDNLPEGDYSVEVKDKNYAGVANACFLTASYHLEQPDPLTVTLENRDTISCYDETTGVLVAHALGGVRSTTAALPYHYQWYKIENNNPVWLTTQTDSIIRNLPAGAYQVRITDEGDPANRVESEIFTITQPTLLTTNLTTRNISCYGTNDGYIRIKVSGGVGGYHLFYKQLSVDVNYREQTINSSNSTFELENLIADNYEIYIIDANNCYAKINSEEICEITLLQPDAPLTIASVVKTDISGFGRSDGSIVLTAEGGTPKDDNTYTIEWRNTNNQLISTPSNLSVGTYAVTITDKNGCAVSDTYTLTQPEQLTGTLEETHFVSCFESVDGQLIAHVQGGVKNPNVSELPYKYTWYSGDGRSLPVLTAIYDSILSNIPAGNYQVIIEDYSRITNSIILNYTLMQPELLTATATQAEVYCGGTTTISVEVQGGTLPYRYEWATGNRTSAVQNVGAGIYPVRVVDARGCETTVSAVVTTPSDLQVSGVTHHPICYEASNGGIELQVSGGVAPYSYLWNTGKTSQNLENVPAGNYFVTVTDVHDCSLFQSFVLTDPEPLQVHIGEDRTLCNGQQLTIAPAVEDPQTSFAWTGPNQFSAITPTVTVNDAGMYRLTITDSNGCQATDSLQVVVKTLDISSEIVVANHIFAGDTIMIVNVSHPEPDRSEWLFNADDPIIVFENEPYYTKVMFTETGNFTIGHRTYVDACYQDDFRTLTVVEAEDRDTTTYGESIVKQFVVYPNPNQGKFSISVELNKVSPIRLRIFDLIHGIVVHDRRETGKEQYLLDYDLSLVPGAYILLLETPSGNLNAKMIAY
jgi:hypothetical protein